ncbi:MAG: hypothetical protein JNM36_14140 [Chitinophagales bacterium]|nr:hypothetical protein [Chitinophagales bacterium]HNI44184.1 hypothetical protein [Chitinophagales bacterium]
MTTFFLLFDEQDEPHVRALQQHLQPLVRQAMLEVLNVADIPAGADKDSETASYHHKATHYLLFVSANSLSNEAIYSQVKAAIDQQKAVWLVLVRPCVWRDALLEQCLVMVNKPITDYAQIDTAYHDNTIAIAQSIDPSYVAISNDKSKEEDGAQQAPVQQQFAAKIYNIQHIDKADFS